jgi:prolyl 4-hydroxylase
VRLQAVLHKQARLFCLLPPLRSSSQAAFAQVLHYGLKEKYGAHMDTFFDARHTGAENGGQRIATALTFLNEPLEGGETVFPNVPATNEGPQWSACARDSLAHKPRTGDMILFWSLKPDGTVDMGATHSACPVIRGEKWSAPLWIRQGPFQQSSKRATAAPNGELATGDACVDLHKECRAWAQSGECKRNAAYMVGDMGQCRDSCNACPYPKHAGTIKGKHA